MMDRLGCLRELAAVTADMLVAAQERDGDRIAGLEERYLAAPADPDADEVALLSREILDRQRALEAQFRPWMDDLRVLFRERRNEQALAATYRPGG
jgi:DNA-binding transcriptional regulator YbjK